MQITRLCYRRRLKDLLCFAACKMFSVFRVPWGPFVKADGSCFTVIWFLTLSNIWTKKVDIEAICPGRFKVLGVEFWVK